MNSGTARLLVFSVWIASFVLILVMLVIKVQDSGGYISHDALTQSLKKSGSAILPVLVAFIAFWFVSPGKMVAGGRLSLEQRYGLLVITGVVQGIVFFLFYMWIWQPLFIDHHADGPFLTRVEQWRDYAAYLSVIYMPIIKFLCDNEQKP
ncbi:hypothetical protein ACFL2Q_09225 [Thermodesulfobacteriota bacterium]